MNYDAIVIGAGHAGAEAALALARTGNKTLLLTLNLDSVSFLACNPSIGGTAKGHLVCEIDALGGQMGINTDKNILQIRMLNQSKGPAVHSLRAQVDKNRYHESMKSALENTENLSIKQAEAKRILTAEGKVTGVETSYGDVFNASAIIVATGVYLNSRTITGETVMETGPSGFSNATHLTKSLIDLGFNIRRFKTGTPPRIDRNSIDLSKFTKQEGDTNIQSFSFLTPVTPKNISVCYLGHTSKETKEIILNNLDKAPVYSGLIEGLGPRYCPAIETKIVRFRDKESHQLFLEPETANTTETYLQGVSTSMPAEIQKQIIQSIPGLEKAEIMRYAYAIEYDCIDSTALYPTLSYKNIKGLYLAGQINGTSGYEEAAAQGIIAGINASLYLKGKPELVLPRDSSYIGVLIDDLVTKGTDEPYRMMTSRAEYRLKLRQDNADLRLTEIGRSVGLVTDKRYRLFKKKLKDLADIREIIASKTIKVSAKLNNFLSKHGEAPVKMGQPLKSLIRRSNLDLQKINEEFDLFKNIKPSVISQLNTEVKYEGYLTREDIIIERQRKNENKTIPVDFDYTKLKGLRIEAIQKLSLIKPLTIGQASRISGVSPADIAVLILKIK